MLQMKQVRRKQGHGGHIQKNEGAAQRRVGRNVIGMSENPRKA